MALPLSPAGLWRRVAALLVDGLALSVLGFALLSLSVVVIGPSVRIELDGRSAPDVEIVEWRLLLDATLVAAMSASYFVAFWTLRSASPGQAVFGIAVTDRNSSPLTPRRALLRWALLGAPFGVIAEAAIDVPLVFLIMFGLSVAWVGVLLVTTRLSASGRGLHDRLSGTSVVRKARV
ncbi:MAG: RDD family protein [Candidatus Limnocylindria bacterium]